MRFVGVDWIQVFVDQLAPKLRLDRVEEAHRPGAEIAVTDPVRVDQVVSHDTTVRFVA